MLLNYRGAHDNTSDGGSVVDGVIRQTGNEAEALNLVGDSAQVVILCRSGIAADAVEDGEFLASTFARGIDGLHYFFSISHAGGDDHRFAFAGDVFDQWQVDRLEGGDLVSWGIEFFEQVDCCVVEGRTEDGDAELASVLEQRLVPFPRHVCFLIELVKRLAVPQAAMDLEVFGITVQGYGVCGVGL